MEEDLKPCPFCGGKAELHECSDGSGHIQCKRCYQTFHDWDKYNEGKSNAIALYNRRKEI